MEAIRNVLIFFLIPFIFAGCLSMMTAEDWERFEANARESGWTEERIDEFRAETKEREEKALAATKAVIHAAIDVVPVPIDKKPVKDLADYWMYLLLGSVPVAEVARRKLVNSEPGKLFGPLKKDIKSPA